MIVLEINITPLQLEAYTHYKKNTMSIEVLKDDCLQKINFRVKNKVSRNNTIIMLYNNIRFLIKMLQ